MSDQKRPFQTHVMALFGDGEHRFELRMKQLLELEEALDAGPFVIFRRLSEATCGVKDIREVLRLGLVGGGLVPTEALRLVMRNHDDYPLETNLALATSIIAAVLFGAALDPEQPQPEAEAA